MMKKVHLLLLLFITHFATIAQESGVISGKITETEGNFSLPGATIKLNVGNKYTISDQNGNFEFLNVN